MREEQDKLKKHPAWYELFEVLKNRDYDEIITYNKMSDITGFDILEKRYIIEAFKREMLRQKNKALESIKNVGYRIVKPNEHARLATKEIHKAERRTRKGVELALCVDFDSLTPTEQGQLTLIANRIQTVHAALIGERKTLKSVHLNFSLPSTPRPSLKINNEEIEGRSR